jgi:hypothetical protein
MEELPAFHGFCLSCTDGEMITSGMGFFFIKKEHPLRATNPTVYYHALKLSDFKMKAERSSGKNLNSIISIS